MIGAMESALPQLGNVESEAPVRRLALGLSASFVMVTLIAAMTGNVPGPNIRAFLPISATLWATAELLTAFFLFSQFYVAGKVAYALIATGYTFTGLMTLPYLYAFPGVFLEPPLATGALQVSVWLWVVWHCLFPLTIAATHLYDPSLEHRTVTRESIGRVLVALVAGAAIFAISIASVIWVFRDELPRVLLPSGHFAPIYSAYVAPVVVLANIMACAVVSRRLKHAKALQVWVAVALLTSALDGLVNATSPGRYTVSWYVGKAEAMITASVVLIMLLFEVSTLYRRLFDVASIDPLTGLDNRRSLDSKTHEVLALLPRMPDGVSLLMLDLDKFKSFNDAYGHAQGDHVLRVVAGVMRACASRPTDRIARYGGEEFVVLLPDTTLGGAERVAERIRATVELTPIVLSNGSFGSITTSIGVAHVPRGESTTVAQMLERADRALYLAKEQGRNRIVVADERLSPIVLPVLT
ncbi:MAG: sensor domain-containing diguanylate cyclase [Vulcanimicrobiaceae bacterium]